MRNSNSTVSKAQPTIDAQFISDAQNFNLTAGIGLLNIDSLAAPLQFLAKARYYLSVIYDEFIKTGQTQCFDREKISNFTANLWNELEQVNLAFSSYDDSIKKLAEPLPNMAEQLHTCFYADDEIISYIGFIDVLIQTIDINKRLDLVCEIALNTK